MKKTHFWEGVKGPKNHICNCLLHSTLLVMSKLGIALGLDDTG